jgi:hypothetical protein
MQTLTRQEATRPGRDAHLPFEARLAQYSPKTHLGSLVKQICGNDALNASMREDLLETIKFTIVPTSALRLKVFRGLDGTPWIHPLDPRYDVRYAMELTARFGARMRLAGSGMSYHPLITPDDPLWARLVEDYGIASEKVVTNAGVDYIVSDFAGGSGDVSNFHFHGLGTDATAEAATDTALGTELTTEYNPNSTRATGTQVANTAPTPDTFTTVGTNTLDSGTPVLREHGIFSASSAGTLLDRSVFSAITLNGGNGDGLQATYTLTLTAGG